MFKSSGPFTEIKFTPDSFAIAFAKRVLPQPGGLFEGKKQLILLKENI